MIAAISHAFPDDSIMGEEDSDILRAEKDKRELLWAHIKDVLDENKIPTQEIGTIKNVEEAMDLIDKGNHVGGPTGSKWASCTWNQEFLRIFMA